MENNKHPTLTNGKVCYVEIPAVDVRRSAEFYEKVFGWRIRQRGDGSIAFDDTVGEGGGPPGLRPPPAATPGPPRGHGPPPPPPHTGEHTAETQAPTYFLFPPLP